MSFKERIYKIRSDLKMSQAEFAEMFDVSRQTVQKWEKGDVFPELSTLIEIAKRFDISLDALILNRDMRTLETMNPHVLISPNYSNMHSVDSYSSGLWDEYDQCLDEGLDIEAYKDVFGAVARLPKGEIKKKFADVIFDIVLNAKQKEDYPYIEPSKLENIRLLRRPYTLSETVNKETIADQIHGAWMGRICGCMLGKTVECMRLYELSSFLKETGNYPLHRYILKSDLDKVDLSRYQFNLSYRTFADSTDGMPADDDTNYTVLSQNVIRAFGRDFTSFDVAQTWVCQQPSSAYCTAERVAYMNILKGYEPPHSAVYKNPYREWIGAQIRADYYGYINPGDPEMAAEMAWRDASISHVKNGIYGAMVVAAMLAAAAVTTDMESIIAAGLAQIPHTSRLYEAITEVVQDYKKGVSQKIFFKKFYDRYDDGRMYHSVHTIPNALIVVASLLYGKGDFSASICMAVEAAFDTDCNAATVGSILGMMNGLSSIPAQWTEPIRDTLHTQIFGMDICKISDLARLTMDHLS